MRQACQPVLPWDASEFALVICGLPFESGETELPRLAGEMTPAAWCQPAEVAETR